MNLTELDALIYEVIVDANGEDEQLWAFRQAFEDALSLSGDGFVIGEPVAVISFDYDGNERRGLTARCRREDGSELTADWRPTRSSRLLRHLRPVVVRQIVVPSMNKDFCYLVQPLRFGIAG